MPSVGRTILVVFLAIVCIITQSPANAGAFLDSYLNPVKLDQRASFDFSKSRPLVVTPRVPIGQTFTTGPDVEKIEMIALAVDGSNEDWQPGENLVVTLYDSRDKKKKLASTVMKYEWRLWDGSVVILPLSAEITPSSSYYFELTVDGGDGTISGVYAASSDYKPGRCYAGGFETDADLWFEIGAKKKWDRDKAYREAFSSWNLDYKGLDKVKEAVSRSDWDTAVSELVSFYESRIDFKDSDRERRQKSSELTDVKLALQMKAKDSAGNAIELAPDWNFSTSSAGQRSSIVSSVGRTLAEGYRRTGDEQYATAWNSMLKSFFLKYPGPLRAGTVKQGTRLSAEAGRGITGGSVWDKPAVESRLLEGFNHYRWFMKSQSFEPDVRAVFILSLVEDAKVLVLQDDSEDDEILRCSLLDFAKAHPELKLSAEWTRTAANRMLLRLMGRSHPDGPLHEPSMDAQCTAARGYLNLLKESKSGSVKVPYGARDRVERLCDFIAHSTLPNGLLPSWGDSQLTSGLDCLKQAFEVFERPDFLYVSSSGRKGKAPADTSAAYPSAGYWMMRSGWGIDDRFLAIRNGESGSSGHADALSFVMAAYGKDLIVDPGNNVMTPEAERLQRTKSHNTITIDDRDARRSKGKSSWRFGNMIDYFDGVNSGYEGLDGINHRRRIIFVRPDYWVISDAVLGKGKHTVDSRFFLRCKSLKLDSDVKAVRTLFMEGGSVMLTPVFADHMKFMVEAGGAAFGTDTLSPVPVYRASGNVELPFTMGWIVTPYLAGKMPEIKPGGKRLPGAGPGVFSTAVTGPGFIDGIAFGEGPDRLVKFDRDGGFAGDVLYGRTNEVGRLTKLAWVNGTNFTSAGTEIVSSEKNVEQLELEIIDDILRIKAVPAEASLKISTKWLDRSRWFSKVAVNGSEPVDVPDKVDSVTPYSAKRDTTTKAE